MGAFGVGNAVGVPSDTAASSDYSPSGNGFSVGNALANTTGSLGGYDSAPGPTGTIGYSGYTGCEAGDWFCQATRVANTVLDIKDRIEVPEWQKVDIARTQAQADLERAKAERAKAESAPAKAGLSPVVLIGGGLLAGLVVVLLVRK